MSSLENKDFEINLDQGISLYSIIKFDRQNWEKNVIFDFLSKEDSLYFRIELFLTNDLQIVWGIEDNKRQKFLIKISGKDYLDIPIMLGASCIKKNKNYELALQINNKIISQEIISPTLESGKHKVIYTMGSAADHLFPTTMTLGEVALYESMQTEEEKERLWSYFKNKWNLQEELAK